MTIKCKQCSNPFEQKAYNHLFCSEECQNKWWLKARRKHWGKKRKPGDPFKRHKVTAERVQAILAERKSGISIDETTFVDAYTKARFIDSDCGEFWAEPRSVLYHESGHPDKAEAKKKSTCLDRFGCEFPQQNKEIALKTARKQTNSYIRTHWKTGEQVVYVGSFECLVVEYLNAHSIGYLWQPKVFTTPLIAPNGKNRTYRPDLYLEDSQAWIEIKGQFRNDAKEKWDWFHAEHPNSELWDRTKLHSLGIKTWRVTLSHSL